MHSFKTFLSALNLVLILAASSPISAKINIKTINDKFHQFLLESIKESQLTLAKTASKSQYNQGKKVLDQLSSNLLALKINDGQFFKKIDHVFVNFRNDYARNVVRGRRISKRGAISDFFDQDIEEKVRIVRDIKEKIPEDEVYRNWEEKLGVEWDGYWEGYVAKKNSEGVGSSIYNSVTSPFKTHEPPVDENFLEFIKNNAAKKNAAKKNSEGVGSSIYNSVTSPFKTQELRKYLAEKKEGYLLLTKYLTPSYYRNCMTETLNSAVDHLGNTVIEKIIEMSPMLQVHLQNSGYAVVQGALEAVQDQDAVTHFGHAAVRGAFRQLSQYGLLSVLIFLPFVILFFAVRLFEIYVYEASDYVYS